MAINTVGSPTLTVPPQDIQSGQNTPKQVPETRQSNFLRRDEGVSVEISQQARQLAEDSQERVQDRKTDRAEDKEIVRQASQEISQQQRNATQQATSGKIDLIA